MQQDIWCFVLGEGNKKIIIQASIHAREYLTSMLVMQQIEYLKDFYFDATIYFVPLVNVDGVKFVLQGAKAFNKQKTKFLNSICTNHRLYKANINGVDLNTNFDALFGMGKANLNYPNYQNYIGPYPHSELETQALVNLTNTVNPDLTISYHLKGEVIYYGFEGQSKNSFILDKTIVNNLCKYTTYKPVLTRNSCGGYKDYCITHFGIPSFTIEVGQDKFSHPFPDSELSNIFNKNKLLPLIAVKELEKVCSNIWNRP